ncbi:MAG: NAD(P)-binding domain-containing protein [Actinomycetota bacterium]|nr:NAD(P)-binding domain-containing protein [Actinomycetota bacterium]
MQIGIVGAGRIGGNTARQLVRAGHDVLLSYSRDSDKLERLAAEIGARAGTSTPREAVALADVAVISVPWRLLDEVLEQLGSLDGKIVVDTTNQYGAAGLEDLPIGRTAAQVNAERMPGARYTKSFNTLTSAFQAEAAGRAGADRAVQWICGDDAEAKRIVAGLIEESGYVAVDLGGTADASVMEAPRRPGAVYGEEYRAADAAAVVAAVRVGQPIPPAPSYPSPSI